MNPFELDTAMMDTTSAPTTGEFMNWGPKTPWNLTADTVASECCTATNPSPPHSATAGNKNSQHCGSDSPVHDTALTLSWATAAMMDLAQDASIERRTSCVIPKQNRQRKGPVVRKVLIKWRSNTISCHFSDTLTPATIIEDTENSEWAVKGSLTKVILTTPIQIMGALLHRILLILQGIKQGDNLTMLVRHAMVWDPFDAVHIVAYLSEDKMGNFLETLQETMSLPTHSNCEMTHEGFPMDLNKTFQESDLPNEPTLLVRVLHSQPTKPLTRSENQRRSEDPDTGAPAPETPSSYTTDNPQVVQRQTQGGVQVLDTDFRKTYIPLLTQGANLSERLLRYATKLQILTSADLDTSMGGRPVHIGNSEVESKPPKGPCLATSGDANIHASVE